MTVIEKKVCIVGKNSVGCHSGMADTNINEEKGNSVVVVQCFVLSKVICPMSVINMITLFYNMTIVSKFSESSTTKTEAMYTLRLILKFQLIVPIVVIYSIHGIMSIIYTYIIYVL